MSEEFGWVWEGCLCFGWMSGVVRVGCFFVMWWVVVVCVVWGWVFFGGVGSWVGVV